MCVNPSAKYRNANPVKVSGGGGATREIGQLSALPSTQIVCAGLAPMRTTSANVPEARSYARLKLSAPSGIAPVNRTTEGACAKSLKADDARYSNRGDTA